MAFLKAPYLARYCSPCMCHPLPKSSRPSVSRITSTLTILSCTSHYRIITLTPRLRYSHDAPMLSMNWPGPQPALNPTKSEVIVLGTSAGISSLNHLNSVNIAGAEIPISQTLKSLGVTFDSKLNFRTHVNNICKGCYFHIRALRHIQSSLPPDLLKTVACSVVCARLDYCNSLLYGTSKENIRKLQYVQNSLARLVSGTRKFDHISPVLASLHWLPVSHRITFKLATLTFKILHSQQPSYLATFVQKYQPTRSLRSSSMNKLSVPTISSRKSVTACRAFSVAAPSIWNSLPTSITDSKITYDIFRQRLKTHLFKLAFE